MADGYLPQQLRDAGQALLSETDKLSMRVQGAMWLYEESLRDWRYYIFTPLAESIGTKKIYEALITLLPNFFSDDKVPIESLYIGSLDDTVYMLISTLFSSSGSSHFSNITIQIGDTNIRHTYTGTIFRLKKEEISRREAGQIVKTFNSKVRSRKRVASKIVDRKGHAALLT